MAQGPGQPPQPQWDARQGRWILPDQGPPAWGGQPGPGAPQGYGSTQGYGPPQQYGSPQGYGHGVGPDQGQRPQAGTGGPQQPPTPQKRRRWPWVLGGFVLLLVLVGAFGGGGDETPVAATDSAPATSVAPAEAPAEVAPAPAPGAVEEAAGQGEVVYEVTGSGSSTSISYGGIDGISQANGESLPWRETAPTDEGFGVYSLTAQSDGSGEITCRITVDGEEIAEQTSTGQFAVVSCSGSSSIF